MALSVPQSVSLANRTARCRYSATLAASKPVYEEFAATVDGGQELIDTLLKLGEGS